MTQNGKSPIKKETDGDLTASIWEDQSANGYVEYRVQITRSFKQGEEWTRTSTLKQNDLLKAARIAQKAYDWILERRTIVRSEEASE